ncbi:MAG: DeoR family transcriptional regulator [Candidatus Pacebacteria bacterium]|nr:DeoR family transcriptional regulator [Candidatus Paceibacterota bacterium]
MFKPNFNISHNLLAYVSSIEADKAIIENSPLVPAWDAKFKKDAMARTVHFGTKIEGNDLTQEQAQKVVRLDLVDDPEEAARKSGIVARERDVQEVINYRNVVKWIDEQDNELSPELLSEKTLKHLHALTMQELLNQEEVGSYRKKQVIVRGAGESQGKVVFRPPVSVEVPYLVEDFFEWLNHPLTQNVHPIFRAAITHYQLVFIHPFVEGNGRTARAFATLVLYGSGYDFKKFFSLEEYFDSNVEQYYRALQSVQQSENSDLSYWLEYFCYGLALEIEKVKNQVEKLSKDLKLKKELGQQVALSERQIILLELLQTQGEITSTDAQEVLPNVSVDTVLRDLKDLIEKGVVKKHGVTKGVTYSLKE